MKKCFCDHCGIEIFHNSDYVNEKIENIDEVFCVDLCGYCMTELSRLQDELIIDYCNIER